MRGSRTLIMMVIAAACVASGDHRAGGAPGSGPEASALGPGAVGIVPEIVDLPEMTLVGIVDAAPDVGQLDFAAMWQRFIAGSAQVEHAVEGEGYELHIQTPAEPCMHVCLVGARVSEVGAVPAEMFVKVLPPCTYAVFTHRVVDGYPKVYQGIGAWLSSAEYETAHPYDLQLYDARFRAMDDPESVHDICVPVRRKEDTAVDTP